MKLLSFSFCLLITSFTSNAFSLEEYKEKIRNSLNTIIGEKYTVKIIGEEKVDYSYKIPVIPKSKKDATDTSVYNKNGIIFEQGKKFNNLPIEQKRVFRISFIKEIFNVTRNIQVKDEELSIFLNVLEQGGSREGVYRAIVNDEIYRSLEDYPQPAKEKLIQFILNLGQTYLATLYSEEGIKKVNIYTIKKIISEKTLEVIDLIANNSDDLFQWYALLSQELATNFPQVLTSKVRSIKDPTFHYLWAKEVPFQHIKSEVLIKLHLVINELNK